MRNPRKSKAVVFGLVLSVALVACGSAGAAADAGAGPRVAPEYRAAPIEGSPEEAALGLKKWSSYAAPIEGSPEEAAIILGRRP